MLTSKIKPLTGKYSDFSGIVLKAAARGHMLAVEHYLKINPQWLNQEGPHGRTLLWEAAYKGRTELVRELIRRGAHVEPLGGYYTPMLVELSALSVARSAGRTELVQLLEDNGAKDDIYAACHRGDLTAIRSFLKANRKLVNTPAKSEVPHRRMGYHPVHYAVAGQQLAALQLLVKRKASIQEHLVLLTDWATGNAQLLKFIKSQAKGKIIRPKTAAQKKATQLQAKSEAQAKGRKSTARKPTSRLPTIDRPNDYGFPPIVEACRGNHNATDDPERVQALLDRRANVNVIDYKGKTPLHRACQAGFIKITQLLIKSKADLNIPDEKGCTPIFDAAYKGRTETLQLLIKRKVNLVHENKQRETVLFYAARQSHTDTVKMLLKAGCDPLHLNTKSKTIAEVMQSKPPTPNRKQIIQILKRASR